MGTAPSAGYRLSPDFVSSAAGFTGLGTAYTYLGWELSMVA